jgi:hypothetical protein
MKRTRYFQWIAGELSGTVETLVDITCTEGEYFYNFADGESCNLRYISKMTNSPSMLNGKFMVEIASPQDPWVAKVVTVKKFTNAGTNETVDVPPIEDITSKTTSGTGQALNVEQSALGTKKFTPPRFSGPFSDLPSLDEYLREEKDYHDPKNIISNSEASQISSPQDTSAQIVAVQTSASSQFINANSSNSSDYLEQKKQPEQLGPIGILAKTCKKHSTDINITVTMDLPSKAVYSMVSEEFENGGIEFIDSLIANLDVKDVIDSIRTSLILAYSKDES